MRTTWGHEDCDALWALPLLSCPRHPGTGRLKEMSMPKISRYGGHSNAGLTERDGGFLPARKDATAAPEPVAASAQIGDAEPEADTAAPFDPNELSVKDVLAMREACTDAEWEAVLLLEQAGSARVGILGK